MNTLQRLRPLANLSRVMYHPMVVSHRTRVTTPINTIIMFVPQQEAWVSVLTFLDESY